MRTKSVNLVDLPDGEYKGRLGGTTVTIRQPENKNIKFEVTYDAAELSMAVFVTIKKCIALVISNGYY